MAKALVYINGKPKLVPEHYANHLKNSDELHRDSTEGPAVCLPNGTEEYYENGVLHRVNGPAIVRADGLNDWYFEGKRHREDGPAITLPNGYEAWMINGKQHRLDGPALIYPNGNEQYYINGIKFTYEDWLKEREKWLKRWYT